jgi:tetratricopeptide (TPR) repeat protein
MIHRMRALCLGFAVAIGWCTPLLASPPDDDVLAGYQRYYRGDKEGAAREFERLVAANPGRLSARFGLLQTLEDRSSANRSLEGEFERQMDTLIADAEARHSRSATDDEALFYLANAHFLRAKYRFDHDKGMWGAARDGARSKRLADLYVKRRPEHGDAYFMLGAYNYYVEIAPSFVKLIRPLLFLPAGNRVEGLKQLERAYTQGSLFSFQAGMLLMEIYATFEGRPADGIRTGEQLARTYPENPEVLFELAELHLGPAVEDYGGAATQYERIIAAESRRAEPREALYRAQLGLASALANQWRHDESIRALTATIDRKPSTPAWVLPSFLLRRANYRALLADAAAMDDVKQVQAEPVRWKDQQKGADSLVKWMTARRASGDEAVYAALLRGNRLAAERKWDEAAAAYEAVRRSHPNDPQLRYRLVQLQFARGDADGASVAAGKLAADKGVPAWIRSQSLLLVGRAHDLAGRREMAKQTYGRVVDDFEKESAAWPAKVGLVTPYRRR